ncbi:MAG: SpoVG family protein [Bacilli bacterium]
MKITNVEIHKINNETSRLKATVNVVIDDCFAVKDIKIISGPDRMFLQMPGKKLPNGEFKDIAHPINKEAREMFETTILEAYNNYSEE